jgi:hypothetical protein
MSDAALCQPMSARPRSIWFVWNPGSASTSDAAGEAVRVALGEAGIAIAGETRFPEEDLPTPAALDRADAEWLAVLAGDGTVNAVARALDGWAGAILVLPGGTMNLLARTLHGDADPGGVIVALDRATVATLPIAEVAGASAYCGIIAGPLAAWVHPREAVRAGRFFGFVRACRQAVGRSLAEGVRVAGAAAAGRRHKAVLVEPVEQGLEVAAIRLESIGAVAEIGMNWLLGDWRAAANVGASCAAEIALGGPRTILLLVDGEPMRVASPVRVRHGTSRVRFVRTRAP